jgi:hypothetical protein
MIGPLERSEQADRLCGPRPDRFWPLYTICVQKDQIDAPAAAIACPSLTVARA